MENPLTVLVEEGVVFKPGTRCASECRTCAYWRRIWPEDSHRVHALTEARQLVIEFQVPYKQFTQWSAGARETLKSKVETLYRDCQRFATDEIAKLVAEVNLEFSDARTLKSKD